MIQSTESRSLSYESSGYHNDDAELYCIEMLPEIRIFGVVRAHREVQFILS
jgi:hypothetical protein